MFFTTPFSNGEGVPYGWLPMGSPGTFIHSGTLGGRLLSSAVAALADPARPPARAAPPTTAPPRRNWRREAPKAYSMLLDLVISRLVLSSASRSGRSRLKGAARWTKTLDAAEIAIACRDKSAWQHPAYICPATSVRGEQRLPVSDVRWPALRRSPRLLTTRAKPCRPRHRRSAGHRFDRPRGQPDGHGRGRWHQGIR